MNTARALTRPILVLNRNWSPIRIATVKEAIGLVAKGSAKIIESGTYLEHDLLSWNDVSRVKALLGDGVVIRSAKLALVPPEVILLKEYDGIGVRSVVFTRRNIFKRDRYACQYCGIQPGSEELTIDHVIPKSKGGASSWENCVLACVECNKRKGDLSVEKAGMKLRKLPKKPTWKSLVRIDPQLRRESWDAFLSRAYWEVELDP